MRSLFRFRGLSERKACEKFKRDICEVGRMLKSPDKIIKKQILEPLSPGIPDSFLLDSWEKNQIF